MCMCALVCVGCMYGGHLPHRQRVVEWLTWPREPQIHIIEEGSVVIDHEGRIADVGPWEDVAHRWKDADVAQRVDARLVDILVLGQGRGRRWQLTEWTHTSLAEGCASCPGLWMDTRIPFGAAIASMRCDFVDLLHTYAVDASSERNLLLEAMAL